MSAEPEQQLPSGERFHDVLAAYLEAVDAGWAPPREKVLARYPQFEAPWRAFFANEDGVGRWAAEFRTDTLPLTGGAAPEGAAPAGAPTLPETAAPPWDGGWTFGEYELLDQLGRGGMGAVFKARHRRLNRTVALKVVLSGRFASPAELQRFRNEAEAVAALDHPHIVPIYEVGEHEGQPYFTMRFLEGGSLGQRPKTNPTPSPGDQKDAARLVASVARAVHHAHQRGILHRDLKPANILLDADGRPHVTDFGLAKKIEGGPGVTLSNAVVGTPCYMAPEQAAGRKGELTTATDVYGLGAMLYELLTGRPPFQADTPLETLRQVVESPPERPSQRQPKVDRDLELVCLKCLEKDPARRYGSAAALAEDLERWSSGVPVTVRTPGVWRRCVAWARRRPVLAVLAGVSAVAVLALAAAAVGLVFSLQMRDAARQEMGLRAEADQQRTSAEQARALAKGYLYGAQLNLAQRAWQENRLPRAVELLEGQRPAPGEEDLRGFEWHYLWRLCHGELMTLPGQQDGATCVRWGPDGGRLASGGKDGLVRVWDARTGQAVWTLEGHAPDVLSLCFSADGKLLASSGAIDRTVKVWDTQTGRELFDMERQREAMPDVCFSPDGKR